MVMAILNIYVQPIELELIYLMSKFTAQFNIFEDFTPYISIKNYICGIIKKTANYCLLNLALNISLN